MCLSKADKQPRKLRSKFGYKSYQSLHAGKRKAPYTEVYYEPVGVWNFDHNTFNMTDEDAKFYPVGYHVWMTRKAAVENAYRGDLVAKVEYSDVVATGIQNNRVVAVARAFRFLE